MDIRVKKTAKGFVGGIEYADGVKILSHPRQSFGEAWRNALEVADSQKDCVFVERAVKLAA